MSIVILGLGPGNPDHLTREAWNVLTQVDELYLRTARHPVVAALPTHLALHSFDSLYESLDNFDTLYASIAERILHLGGRPSGVVYAVPGHPLIGESSVQKILTRAREESLDVKVVDGLSFVEPVLSMLGVDGLQGVQLSDATDLAAALHPPLNPDRPVLVGQLYNQRLASEVKLTLMSNYPDEHPVTVVRSAGTPDAELISVPLYQLDRGQPIDHLTTLFLPSLPDTGGLAAFQGTVALLRAPDGCPWDREQTHLSLRPALLEEAYEAIAALDEEDPDKLCEELGDLLMQIAMHAQIASETGGFRLSDIIGQIDAKLKRRHPHVFGDVEVESSADVLRNWEDIKSAERASNLGNGASRSRLSTVPNILPSLARAQSLGERAARVGFDWPDADRVLDKVSEELLELKAAGNLADRESEFGDLLFALVNTARWLHIDAESALRNACDRFTARFSDMEREAEARGAVLSDLSQAELDALWEHAKLREQNTGGGA